MAANVESVCYRYHESPDQYAAELAYVFPVRAMIGVRAISPVQALKACECFDYQACEVEGYDRSKAANLIRCIRGLAIAALPGYADAEWEISGDRKAA